MREGFMVGATLRNNIVDEAKKQLWIAVPMTLVSLFTFSIPVISLMFVGQLGELELSGAALATSLANVTGFVVLMGMATALDTYCGQSFGAQQFQLLGIHMQRAMLVLLLVTIPQSIFWAHLKPILVAMHQDPEISAKAEAYARHMIPGLSAYGLLQCCIRFLQNQNIVFPMVYTSGFTALMHVVICWLLVVKTAIGSEGAAVAICISNWLNMILLVLYIKFSPSCKSTWTGFSRESLHNIPRFLTRVFASAVMFCLESWMFEVTVLLSGVLPNPQLQTSVLSISINTTFIFWMIAFGFGAASSTRVSYELGAGCPRAAYLAVKVNFGMSMIEGLLSSTILMLIRSIWGRAFTNVEEVVKVIKSMMPLLAANAFLDAIQAALLGVVRGCGRQKLGAVVNLGSYYIVGIPSSVVLAFVLHMKGQGLWLGIVLALTVQVLCLFLITLCTNWEREAKRAAEGTSGTPVSLHTQPAGDLTATLPLLNNRNSDL